MKKSKVHIVFLIFMLVFGGIGFSFLTGVLTNHRRAIKIIDNGQQVEAKVIDFNSNTTVNEESIYYLIVEYITTSGELIEAKTPSIYYYYEASSHYDRGVITVYHLEGKLVIPPGYKMPTSTIIMLILGSVFSLLGIIFACLFVKNARNNRLMKIINLKGQTAKGHLVRVRGGVQFNDVSYYAVYFNYKTENHEIVNAKTPFIYQNHEVEYLTSLETFKIKYLGHKAIIIEEIDLDTIRQHAINSDDYQKHYSKPTDNTLNDYTTRTFWSHLDQLVYKADVIIDRPKGTTYNGSTYELDYGYLKDTSSSDGAEVDIWQGSNSYKNVVGIICTVDLRKKDTEIKILLGCDEIEIEKIVRFHNNYDDMKGIFIKRPQ